ncbi:MAG: exported protein of unknown function [Nitrospira sp.]|nr:exported protein of unknown function [Nitrospira sp.]
MTINRGEKAMLVFATGLALGLCVTAVVQGQVIHSDQMIGPSAPQKEAIPEGGVTSNEPALGELDRGFDRQMVMPETGPSGDMDTTMLKTPDATDAENARESDSKSAVSF